MHVALVLMTGNRDFAGGVPAVTWQRASYLVQKGHEVSIICGAQHDWYMPEVRDNVHIYPVRPPIGRIDSWFMRRHATRAPGFLRALGRGLQSAHARKALDIVDLQDGAGILGAGPFCRSHNVPMTFTIHGSAALNPAPRPWLGRALHIRYENMAWRQAKLVLPVSKFISSAGKRFGDFDAKIRVVPNTVQESWLLAGRERRIESASNLPLRLLFLARLAPEKRPKDMLHAMQKVPQDVAHLQIVGGGSLEEPMRKLARQLGLENRVTFSGFVSDRSRIEEYLNQADAFVFPTEFEAMSIALLEAMAFGLYPIASDIGPNAELLPAKYLFPLGDSDKLAERIRELAADRSKLEPARSEMLSLADQYRIETVYERLESAYNEAARR